MCLSQRRKNRCYCLVVKSPFSVSACGVPMFCLLRSAIARVLHRCPQHTASCVSLVVIAVFGCFLGLAEHAPPRLDSAVITQLVVDFKANYPGEYLDGDAMPSVRLLSLVHKWFTPGEQHRIDSVATAPVTETISRDNRVQVKQMLRTEAHSS